ncbi:MAG: alpha/beta fold hydrolase [Deltaproteobacteria bacterium]|nr:alpha/beta fold hydrolase [Deltaproteobacteria bacterium]
MSRRHIVAKEALAYLRTAAYASTPQHRHQRGDEDAPGLFLVHGVGATPAQFRLLAKALAKDVAFVDDFAYRSTRPLRDVTDELSQAIELRAARHVAGMVVVGHSLGGLLLRMVLQSDRPPERVVGFVSICAPLHGTTRCALAPTKDLRSITPGSKLFQQLDATHHRLEFLRGRLLAVGSTSDHFVEPKSSAYLPDAPVLELRDSGHVSSLFDERVHEAIRKVIRAARMTRMGGRK